MEFCDKQALQIHGIISSDSDSDFDCKKDFDEEYKSLKPPPYRYDSIKHKIVIISPEKPPIEEYNVWTAANKKKKETKSEGNLIIEPAPATPVTELNSNQEKDKIHRPNNNMAIIKKAKVTPTTSVIDDDLDDNLNSFENVKKWECVDQSMVSLAKDMQNTEIFEEIQEPLNNFGSKKKLLKISYDVEMLLKIREKLKGLGPIWYTGSKDMVVQPAIELIFKKPKNKICKTVTSNQPKINLEVRLNKNDFLPSFGKIIKVSETKIARHISPSSRELVSAEEKEKFEREFPSLPNICHISEKIYKGKKLEPITTVSDNLKKKTIAFKQLSWSNDGTDVFNEPDEEEIKKSNIKIFDLTNPETTELSKELFQITEEISKEFRATTDSMEQPFNILSSAENLEDKNETTITLTNPKKSTEKKKSKRLVQKSNEIFELEDDLLSSIEQNIRNVISEEIIKETTEAATDEKMFNEPIANSKNVLNDIDIKIPDEYTEVGNEKNKENCIALKEHQNGKIMKSVQLQPDNIDTKNRSTASLQRDVATSSVLADLTPSVNEFENTERRKKQLITELQNINSNRRKAFMKFCQYTLELRKKRNEYIMLLEEQEKNSICVSEHPKINEEKSKDLNEDIIKSVWALPDTNESKIGSATVVQAETEISSILKATVPQKIIQIEIKDDKKDKIEALSVQSHRISSIDGSNQNLDLDSIKTDRYWLGDEKTNVGRLLPKENLTAVPQKSTIVTEKTDINNDIQTKSNFLNEKIMKSIWSLPDHVEAKISTTNLEEESKLCSILNPNSTIESTETWTETKSKRRRNKKKAKLLEVEFQTIDSLESNQNVDLNSEKLNLGNAFLEKQLSKELAAVLQTVTTDEKLNITIQGKSNSNLLDEEAIKSIWSVPENVEAKIQTATTLQKESEICPILQLNSTLKTIEVKPKKKKKKAKTLSVEFQSNSSLESKESVDLDRTFLEQQLKETVLQELMTDEKLDGTNGVREKSNSKLLNEEIIKSLWLLPDHVEAKISTTNLEEESEICSILNPNSTIESTETRTETETKSKRRRNKKKAKLLEVEFQTDSRELKQDVDPDSEKINVGRAFLDNQLKEELTAVLQTVTTEEKLDITIQGKSNSKLLDEEVIKSIWSVPDYVETKIQTATKLQEESEMCSILQLNSTLEAIEIKPKKRKKKKVKTLAAAEFQSSSSLESKESVDQSRTFLEQQLKEPIVLQESMTDEKLDGSNGVQEKSNSELLNEEIIKSVWLLPNNVEAKIQSIRKLQECKICSILELNSTVEPIETKHKKRRKRKAKPLDVEFQSISSFDGSNQDVDLINEKINANKALLEKRLKEKLIAVSQESTSTDEKLDVTNVVHERSNSKLRGLGLTFHECLNEEIIKSVWELPNNADAKIQPATTLQSETGNHSILESSTALQLVEAKIKKKRKKKTKALSVELENISLLDELSKNVHLANENTNVETGRLKKQKENLTEDLEMYDKNLGVTTDIHENSKFFKKEIMESVWMLPSNTETIIQSTEKLQLESEASSSLEVGIKLTMTKTEKRKIDNIDNLHPILEGTYKEKLLNMSQESDINEKKVDVTTNIQGNSNLEHSNKEIMESIWQLPDNINGEIETKIKSSSVLEIDTTLAAFKSKTKKNRKRKKPPSLEQQSTSPLDVSPQNNIEHNNEKTEEQVLMKKEYIESLIVSPELIISVSNDGYKTDDIIERCSHKNTLTDIYSEASKGTFNGNYSGTTVALKKLYFSKEVKNFIENLDWTVTNITLHLSASKYEQLYKAYSAYLQKEKPITTYSSLNMRNGLLSLTDGQVKEINMLCHDFINSDIGIKFNFNSIQVNIRENVKCRYGTDYINDMNNQTECKKLQTFISIPLQTPEIFDKEFPSLEEAHRKGNQKFCKVKARTIKLPLDDNRTSIDVENVSGMSNATDFFPTNIKEKETSVISSGNKTKKRNRKNKQKQLIDELQNDNSVNQDVKEDLVVQLKKDTTLENNVTALDNTENKLPLDLKILSFASISSEVKDTLEDVEQCKPIQINKTNKRSTLSTERLEGKDYDKYSLTYNENVTHSSEFNEWYATGTEAFSHANPSDYEPLYESFKERRNNKVAEPSQNNKRLLYHLKNSNDSLKSYSHDKHSQKTNIFDRNKLGAIRKKGVKVTASSDEANFSNSASVCQIQESSSCLETEAEKPSREDFDIKNKHTTKDQKKEGITFNLTESTNYYANVGVNKSFSNKIKSISSWSTAKRNGSVTRRYDLQERQVKKKISHKPIVSYPKPIESINDMRSREYDNIHGTMDWDDPIRKIATRKRRPNKKNTTDSNLNTLFLKLSHAVLLLFMAVLLIVSLRSVVSFLFENILYFCVILIFYIYIKYNQ